MSDTYVGRRAAGRQWMENAVRGRCWPSAGSATTLPRADIARWPRAARGGRCIVRPEQLSGLPRAVRLERALVACFTTIHVDGNSRTCGPTGIAGEVLEERGCRTVREDGIWYPAQVLADIRMGTGPGKVESSGMVTPLIIERLAWRPLADAWREDPGADWRRMAGTMTEAFGTHVVPARGDVPAHVADRYAPKDAAKDAATPRRATGRS